VTTTITTFFNAKKFLHNKAKKRRSKENPKWQSGFFFLGGILTFFQPAKYDFDTYSPDCTYFPRL